MAVAVGSLADRDPGLGTNGGGGQVLIGASGGAPILCNASSFCVMEAIDSISV